MTDQTPPPTPDQANQRGCMRRFWSTGGGALLGGGMAGVIGALLGGGIGALGGVLVAWPFFMDMMNDMFADSGGQGSGVFLLVILLFAALYLGGGALVGGGLGALLGGGAGVAVGGMLGGAVGNVAARVPWVRKALAVLGALGVGLVVLWCVMGWLRVSAPPTLPPPNVARPPTVEPLASPPLTPLPGSDRVTYAEPTGQFTLAMPTDWQTFPLTGTELTGVVLRSPDSTSEVTVLVDPEEGHSMRRAYMRALVADYFAPYGVTEDAISLASFTDTYAEGWLREYFPFTYVGPNGDTWQGRIYVYHDERLRALLMIGSADPDSYQNEDVIAQELVILRSYQQR